MNRLLIKGIICGLWLCSRGISLAEPEWVWVGAVTTEGAVMRTGWKGQEPKAVWIESAKSPGQRKTLDPQIQDAGEFGKIATYVAGGMAANEVYRYGWGDSSGGQFQTFPKGAANFSFAFSSCAQTGSNNEVFDQIREKSPLFFLHTGDMHYSDIAVNDVKLYREALRKVMAAPRQNQLFRSMSVPYMWDDHDYGPNGADRNSPSREAAMTWYRQEVPHYPLGLGNDPLAPVAHAFTVGRVRFIITDSRSGRDPKLEQTTEPKSMLGKEQLAWFKKEVLEAHSTHGLVIWMTGVPWIAPKGERKADSWSVYSEERQAISDFLVENKITNICGVAGDAHMLAFDDGSNNTFASDGKGAGFPMFHAAALGRPGTFKGGPYSGGRIGNHKSGSYGQFGMMHITDDGKKIDVKFEGFKKDKKVMEHQFTRP